MYYGGLAVEVSGITFSLHRLSGPAEVQFVLASSAASVHFHLLYMRFCRLYCSETLDCRTTLEPHFFKAVDNYDQHI